MLRPKHNLKPPERNLRAVGSTSRNPSSSTTTSSTTASVQGPLEAIAARGNQSDAQGTQKAGGREGLIIFY
eukprot:372901-Rhodomonas_salina.1